MKLLMYYNLPDYNALYTYFQIVLCDSGHSIALDANLF
jgi:hypothetical protein